MITEVLVIYFENEITPHEIPLFRGAIINSIDSDSLLFHNHTELGVRYGYPLIQYKSIGGHACLVGIADAAFTIMQLVDKFPCSLKIGKKEMEFHVLDCRLVPYFPKMEDAPKLYHLKDYIALTEDNFKKYHSLLALTDKVNFLEQIIIGNILSFPVFISL